MYFVEGDINTVNRLLYNPDILTQEAEKLVRKAKVKLVLREGCNVLNIYDFQNILPEYYIFVYSDKSNGNKCYCHSQSQGKRINILL